MLRRDVYFFGLLSLALLGCGGGSEASPPPAAPKTPAKGASGAADQGPAKAPDKIERETLKTVLPMGLPWLLRRVWPEEVFRDGKFVGWRLVAIPEEWTGLDVRPDDVVTRINGKTVETPEQLWDAWTSLATAPELRVTYERGAETKEIVLPIAGAPAPELLASLTNPSPPPRKATTKRGTIVIESRDPAGDDPDTK
ncbi:serine protease [Polyangium jinanense]|uniref:Serine protease n=1 Tax=Polyangium jinanense TaxID=2829994 RepID=A0A9X3X763_9BACT|nr:serine protease [Polyangium jinanense]MDC3959052.1 serine protease [Polyangium jinanense]MDC3984025.1 serine protease [Polyangium jinanense]